MKVYNKEKTQLLESYDISLGRLQPDVLITHIEEQLEVKEKYHYKTIAKYDNGGRTVEKVIDVKGQPYIPEHDETENILIYIPYSEQELEEIQKDKLRAERVNLLKAFDVYKSNVMYGIEVESESQKQLILRWYKDLLDLKPKSFDEIPEKIIYYME